MKWVNMTAYDEWLKQREQEKTQRNYESTVWKPKEKGTVDKAKVYEGRFLQDPNGLGFKKFYYHFWQNGDEYIVFLCPKTWGMKNFCGFCFSNQRLWAGSKEDQQLGKKYKRIEGYASNFYVVNDPRDHEKGPDEEPFAGKTWIYEFGQKVVSKLDDELVPGDEKKYGPAIFDPGDDGVNFAIKVKSTKPAQDGTIFPDYSDSAFDRTRGPLGTKKQIQEIMSQRKDLIEHVKTKEISTQKMKELLTEEMLWTSALTREWSKAYPDDPGEEPEPSETKDIEVPSSTSPDVSEQPEVQDDDTPDEVTETKASGNLNLLAELDKYKDG